MKRGERWVSQNPLMPTSRRIVKILREATRFEDVIYYDVRGDRRQSYKANKMFFESTFTIMEKR
jgi:DNA-binding transcriptional regulator GbsR (MarR family)